MATNTALLSDRFNEIASVAALKQLSSRLSDLAMEPSTKRFVRNRANAAACWAEVRELATVRAAAAAKPAPAAKRAVKRAPAAKPVDLDAVPITNANSTAGAPAVAPGFVTA